MSMKQTIAKLFGAECGILGITSLLACISQAAPIPLPDWAKPIESQLPKISPEIISEVDDLYTFWTINGDRLPIRELKQEFNPVAWRMVALKEQASQALIWQFLREANRHAPAIRYLLTGLSDDRDLAASLLPVIRCRMDWLKQIMQDGKIKEYAVEYSYHSELDAIEQYLFSQGEPSDLEALDRLMEEDVKHGNPTFSDRGTPEQLGLRIKTAQEWSQKHNAPYWYMFADYLIEQGLLTKEALMPGQPAPSRGDKSNPPKDVSSSNPLPEAMPQTHFLQPWMVWLLIGGVLVFLLGMWLRNPKPK